MPTVALQELREYDSAKTRAALKRALELCGASELIKPGMKVLIKANLLMRKNPAAACTTHPEIVRAVIAEAKARGAHVVVGDSPGGPFSTLYLRPIYEGTGMAAVCRDEGAELNLDCGITEVSNPQGLAMRQLTVMNAALNCDMIINVCKLKTHGLMGYTGAVKNMFGVIPGTHKAELHTRFPDVKTFSQMLVDIERFIKPAISIMDAVVGMEGDGPSAGTPREVGVLLASTDPHALDSVAAGIIGLAEKDVPTLARALEMGLIPPRSGIATAGDDPARFFIRDFKTLEISDDAGFLKLKGPVGMLASALLRTKPSVDKAQCVGCGDCARNCPPHAITMKNGKPSIDLKECIRCYCCQELCPRHAVSIAKPLVTRIFK